MRTMDQRPIKQTIENQLRELRQIADRRAWEVVHEYHDAGIGGAKSREAQPGARQDAQASMIAARFSAAQSCR
jgi:DNA invertase Pin-like site-specific DNA recombinase